MDVKIQCVAPDVTASQRRIALKPDTPEVIGGLCERCDRSLLGESTAHELACDRCTDRWAVSVHPVADLESARQTEQEGRLPNSTTESVPPRLRAFHARGLSGVVRNEDSESGVGS